MQDLEVTTAVPYQFYIDVENLQVRLNATVKSLCAVHNAMEHQDMGQETYTAAVFGVYEGLSVLSEELGNMCEAVDAFRCATVKEVQA